MVDLFDGAKNNKYLNLSGFIICASPKIMTLRVENNYA